MIIEFTWYSLGHQHFWVESKLLHVPILWISSFGTFHILLGKFCFCCCWCLVLEVLEGEFWSFTQTLRRRRVRVYKSKLFAIWFSENEGGVKGRLEFSRKFIRFGTVTRPSAIMKLENEVQKIYSIGDWENLIMLLHKKTINKLIHKLQKIRLLWLRAKIQYYQ